MLVGEWERQAVWRVMVIRGDREGGFKGGWMLRAHEGDGGG